LELCARRRSTSQAFRARWLLLLFHYFRAELSAAEAITAELMKLAHSLEDPFCRLEAHRGVGSTVLELGRFKEALHHHDQVAAISAANTGQAYESFTGQDPKLVSDCHAARALWALGYPDTALDRVEGALALARKSSHAERLIIVTHFAAQLHQLRGEPSACQQRSEM